MKKMLIGALVGGIILFIWQFLSWSMLNVHGSELSYTPNQDQIMAVLSENLDEGSYFLPNVAPGTPADQHQQYMEGQVGKPWAKISYHKSLDMGMGMNMFRGFIIDFVAVWLLCWILLKFAHLDFMTTLLTSLAVGAIGYFTISYLNSIWFEDSSMGYLVDTVAQWGLTGCWLGWWLNR